MKRRHVVWSAAERAALVQGAVRIMRAQPKMPAFRAVLEAQNSLLPENRRRTILSKAFLGHMATEIEQTLNSPVPHVVGPVAAEDAIAEAARSVAARFEAELRAALSHSTARIVKQAAEGKL